MRQFNILFTEYDQDDFQEGNNYTSEPYFGNTVEEAIKSFRKDYRFAEIDAIEEWFEDDNVEWIPTEEWEQFDADYSDLDYIVTIK